MVEALGLQMVDLFDEPPKRRSDTIDAPRRGRRSRSKTAARPATGANAANLPDKRSKKTELGEPTGPWRQTASWVYTDADGTPYGRVIRRDRPHEHGTQRQYTQRHWDQSSSSWKTGAPKPAVLYRLPEVLAAIADGRTIYLCEGESDADAMVAAEVVATCHTNDAKGWKADYAQTLTGAHVVVVVDRDKPGYDRGIAAYDDLLPVAASVRVVEPTIGKDARDHLEDGRAVAAMKDITRLLTMEVPTAEAASRTSATGEVSPEPVPSGDPGQRGRHLRPVPDPNTGPGRSDEGGGGRGGSGSGGGQGAERPNERIQYLVRHGELVRLIQKDFGPQKDLGPQYEVVLGCRARIVRVEQKISSEAEQETPTTTGYLLELTHPDHEGEVHQLRIDRKDWDAVAWLHDLPWANVTYDSRRSGLARIRDAIRMTSDDAEVVALHTAPGWIEHPEHGWTYVHAGGGITACGPVNMPTDFPDKLSHYKLPEPATDPADIRAAAAHSFALLDLLPPRIGAPLAGLAYRGVIRRMQPTVALQGGAGSYKSSMARVALHHVAPELEYDQAVLSLSELGSSPKYISRALYQFRDTLCLADDAAPDKSRRAAAERLGTIIRIQYNGDSRDILTMESEMRASKPSRTSLITAAEVGPSATSAAERTLTVPFYKGQIDVEARKALWQSDARRGRALLTASYLRWMAGQREQILQKLDSRVSEYEDAWREQGCTERVAQSLAHIAAGWRFQLDHVVEVGAYTQDEAEQLWQRAWNGLAEASRAQNDPDEPVDLAGRVLGLLRSVLLAPMAHLTLTDGSRPDAELAQRLGWVQADRAPGDVELVPGQGLRPAGKRLGAIKHVDGQWRMYLNPHLVLAALRQLTAQTGDTFEESTATIAEALDGKGVLATSIEKGKRRRTLNRSMFGGRDRVWDIPMSAVLGNDSDPGSEAISPPVTTPPAGPFTAVPAATTSAEKVGSPLPEKTDVSPPSAEASRVTAASQDAGVTGTCNAEDDARHVLVGQRLAQERVSSSQGLQPCVSCGQPCAALVNDVRLHPACPFPATARPVVGQAVTASQPSATEVLAEVDGMTLDVGAPRRSPASPTNASAAQPATPSASTAHPSPAELQLAGSACEAGIQPQSATIDQDDAGMPLSPAEITVRNARIAYVNAHHQVARTDELGPCEVCGSRTAVLIDEVRMHAVCHPDAIRHVPARAADPQTEDGQLVVEPQDSCCRPLAPAAPAPATSPPTGTAGQEPVHASHTHAGPQSGNPRHQAKQHQAKPGRASGPEQGAAQPQMAEPRWRAPAAVADADGVYLPDGEVVPLPEPLTHLGHLAELTAHLRLGWGGGKTLPETGHILVTGALMLKLGLPTELVEPPEKWRISDEDELLAEVAQQHPLVTGAIADGWGMSQSSRQRLAPWLRIWKERQSAFVSFLPLVKAAGMETLLGDDPSPAALAHRLQLYAQHVGIPFRVSNGATGIDLIAHLDHNRRRVITEPVEPVPPAAHGAEARLIWHRAPTPEERQLRYLHAYDASANYLSGARHTKLGIGPAEHRVGPDAVFDPKLPGYWLVRVPDWTDWNLPSPFNSLTRVDGWHWLTTPTLYNVYDLFDIKVEVKEAWVWPDHTQYLNKWAEQLDTARLALIQEAADGNADAEAVLAAVKDTYRAGIGRLGYHAAAGKVFYRPDWQHLIMAQSQGNLLRKLVKVADQSHRWPLAIDVDNVLFASNDPNPATAIPEPMQLGRRLGQFKHKGSGLMEELGDRLGVGPAFAFRRLTPPEQWKPSGS
ncbi:hypothetical protein ACFY4C_40130 [Actinomadura viridis]|uniref:hypothetical protein n=1 Tax=Actinomadura viridis TaxID=58110 RepID=UPI00369A4BD9